MTRKILIVDDNPTNRALASAFITRKDWEADEAESGEEALAMLRVQSYDAVLLDISMPGMSGIDVCERIRAMNHAKPLYLVAYTAYAMESEIDKILSTGFDSILIKPISRSRLNKAFSMLDENDESIE